jgi:hypothetical protein
LVGLVEKVVAGLTAPAPPIAVRRGQAAKQTQGVRREISIFLATQIISSRRVKFDEFSTK